MVRGELGQEVERMQHAWEHRDIAWRLSPVGVQVHQYIEELRNFTAVVDDMVNKPGPAGPRSVDDPAVDDAKPPSRH